MPFIPFRRVLSCSSEDQTFCAENLLKPELYKKKWLSAKGGEESITCILELETSCVISSIDIGNEGSAFIEIFVSRSASSSADQWTVLLPATLLMSPNDSRSNINRNQVKLLKANDLNKAVANEKWDRVKIVCEQKFNRISPFGLSFIKFCSPAALADETNQVDLAKKPSMIGEKDYDDADETKQAQGKIGSFFAKKQAEKKRQTLEPSASDQIRALSNVAEELLSTKPMDDQEIQTLLKKEVKAKSTESAPSKRRLSEELTTVNSPIDVKRSKIVDLSKVMTNVVFVMSGFQNPLRSELRNKATTMGAIYSDDWDEQCTHLICAFHNTPKFTQVHQSGSGAIVNKQWILDCYEQKRLLPEKNYQLTGSKSETPTRRQTKVIRLDDEEDEPKISTSVQRKTPTRKTITTFDDDDEDEDEEPIQTRAAAKKRMVSFDDDDDEDDDEDQALTSKGVARKTPSTRRTTTSSEMDDVYDAETDDDEPPSKKKTFKLVDFFHDKHFYVFDDEYDEKTLHDIRRVIYAYDGVLEKQLTPNVNYVITKQMWNSHFDKVAKSHPKLQFLTLDWLQDCHDEDKLVPCQPYLITP